MFATTTLRGRKGGSKPRPAVEAPDSLQSLAKVKVLDAIGEGEIVGLVNGLQSVYLDETPLQNSDGSQNFSGVTVDTRTGSQDQGYIPGFPSVESETAVGVELRAGSPWSRQVQRTDLSALRLRLSVTRLAKTNKSNGDVNGYRVEYAVDLQTDGGAFVQVLSSAFDGKTTDLYERTHRIELPAASSGWVVRVRRITPNATDSSIADTTRVEAITEVVDAKLRYPGTALVGLQYDAQQFSSQPSRAYHIRGRIIRVPSNYDPASRSYTGVWDGTFKLAYTDNPAWVYLDLLTHFRYGLGHLLTLANVDKWSLYQIARYCDELVPDGKGGQEPRFTVFLPLTKQADALRVLQDLSAVFRGMTCWGGGLVSVSADMPSDPVYTYTQANVIDGAFRYGGTERKSRATVAYVTWTDPADFYRQKVEYVPDPAGIARYGIQEVSITAVGCKSQGQAQRAGKWALLTNRLETESVSFSVGLDGVLARPGQVIRVADARRAGRRIGGRIRAATATSVLLDAAAVVAGGDTLTVLLPSGIAETRTVKSVASEAGSIRVTVTQAFSAVPVGQSVWAVESATLKAQLFRVVRVAESGGEGKIAYEITALEYNPSKHAAIDTGTRIEQRPTSVIPLSVQAPPTDVQVAARAVIEQGIAVSVMEITCKAPAGAVAFEYEWRKDSGDWVYAGRSGAARMEVRGIYAGRYVARVRAVNALDAASLPAYSAETVLVGKTTPPPALTFIKTTPKPMALGLEWGFPEGVGDTQRTEIWYSTSPTRDAGSKLGDFAFPQNVHALQGLAAGATFYFWGRLVDKTGNIGPWFPEGLGVSGQSSVDATELLGYLAGQIGETQLGQHLIDRIAVGEGAASAVAQQQRELAQQAALLSDALAGAAQDLAQEAAQRSSGQKAVSDALQAEVKARQDAVNVVAGNLLAEVTARQQAVQSASDSLSARISALDSAVSDILGTQEYSASVAMPAGGLATYNGKLYRAKAALAVPVPVPTDANSWTLLGDYTSIGAAVGDLASRMTTAETAQASQASRLSTVESKASDSASRVATLEQTTASQASTLQQLKTSDGQQTSNIASLQQTSASQAQAVQQLQTENAGQASAITSLQQTDASQAQAITSLDTRLTAAEGVNTAQATALQSLDTKVTQQGDSLSAQGSAITSLGNRLTSAEGVNDAQAQAISGLSTRVADAEGQLSSQSQAVTSLGSSLDRTALDGLYSGEADADLAAAKQVGEATAKAVQTLGTKVTQQGDTLAAQGSAVTSLDARLTAAEGVNASQATALQSLDAKVTQQGSTLTSQGSAITGLDSRLTAAEGVNAGQATALQSLDTKVTQQGNTLASQGSAITALDSRLGSAEGVNDAQAQALGSLATRVTDTEGQLASQSQSLTSLESRVSAPSLDALYSGEADAGLAAAKQDSELAAKAVQSLGTKVTQQGDSLAAQGSAITALDTRLTSAEGTATAAAGAVQQLDTKVTQQGDTLSAQASSLSQLSAQVGDTSAAVQTTQQAVADLQGGLSTMYSVKLQVASNGKVYAAGMGLGIENTPNGMQSQVLFQADRFAVINAANGQISTPFVIQGGQVFINSAIIGDGTIGMAKIASALQSTNYVAGQSGWRLTQSGQFELNANVAGQGRLTMSNQLIQVFDSNGTLRVRLGIW